MWIAARTRAVSWGSSPPADQGQFETLPAVSGEGTDLAEDVVASTIVRICLTVRISSRVVLSVVANQPSGLELTGFELLFMIISEEGGSSSSLFATRIC